MIESNDSFRLAIDSQYFSYAVASLAIKLGVPCVSGSTDAQYGVQVLVIVCDDLLSHQHARDSSNCSKLAEGHVLHARPLCHVEM